jgi:hypothetical protein
MVGVLLLHTPPVVPQANNVEEPTQTPNEPVMAVGVGFTVTIADTLQPAAVA